MAVDAIEVAHCEAEVIALTDPLAPLLVTRSAVRPASESV